MKRHHRVWRGVNGNPHLFVTRYTLIENVFHGEAAVSIQGREGTLKESFDVMRFLGDTLAYISHRSHATRHLTLRYEKTVILSSICKTGDQLEDIMNLA